MISRTAFSAALTTSSEEFKQDPISEGRKWSPVYLVLQAPASKIAKSLTLYGASWGGVTLHAGQMRVSGPARRQIHPAAFDAATLT
jgi:hypothetical protein